MGTNSAFTWLVDMRKGIVQGCHNDTVWDKCQKMSAEDSKLFFVIAFCRIGRVVECE